jgi:hypothetical protein
MMMLPPNWPWWTRALVTVALYLDEARRRTVLFMGRIQCVWRGHDYELPFGVIDAGGGPGQPSSFCWRCGRTRPKTESV